MAMREFVTDVTVLIDGNATVASIDLIDTTNGGMVLTVTGSAKRDRGDRHNEEISVNLAVGRAFEKLGRRLNRKANGLVRQAEHVAEAKRARKAKRDEAIRIETKLSDLTNAGK